MQVNIHLAFCTEIDGNIEKEKIDTLGNFLKTESGYIISYMEQLEDSLTAVKITITQDSVTIDRKGPCSVTFLMEENKVHSCAYSTPYGVLDMQVKATSIQNSLTPNGGHLEISYILDMDGETFHTLSLTI